MNKQIRLNDNNFKLLNNKKTTSIRIGVKDYTVGDSMIVNIDTGAVYACTITKVELIKFKDLDYFRAVNDGFKGQFELVRELKKCYQRFDIDNDEPVTVVTFNF